jgi:hypothetical protein
MSHQCNNYCLQSNKTNAPRTCQVHFGKMDTQGLPRIPRSRIITDKKSISHFRMTRTELVRVVQHSRILLRSWRANSDIKQLLYYSDSSRGSGPFFSLFFFCSGGKPMRIFCSGHLLTLFSQRQKLDRPAPNSHRFFDTMKIAPPP